MRRRHPARAAPRRPEINKDRHFAVANSFVELLGTDLDGFSDRG
jgi:hypothetical protein